MSIAIERATVPEGMSLEEIASQILSLDELQQLDLEESNKEIRRMRDEKLAAWAAEISSSKKEGSEDVVPGDSEESPSEEESEAASEEESEAASEEESEAASEEESEATSEEESEAASEEAFVIEHFIDNGRPMFRMNGYEIAEEILYKHIDSLSGREVKNQIKEDTILFYGLLCIGIVFFSLFFSILQFGLLKMKCQ